MGRVQGVILAGGESRRYGSDKAFALWKGKPFLRCVAEALLTECDELVILGRSGVPVERYREVVPEARTQIDVKSQAGPVNALRSAVGLFRAPWIIVAPCDAPGLTPEDVTRLLKESRAAKGAGIGASTGGKIFDLFCMPRNLLDERLKTAKRLEDLVLDARVVGMSAEFGINVNEPPESKSGEQAA